MKKTISLLLLLFSIIGAFAQSTTPTMRKVANAGTAITKLPSSIASSVNATNDTVMVFQSSVWKKAKVSTLTGGTNWNIAGNSGTTAGTNFLGTTDAQDLVFKRNSSEVMRLYSASNFVGIGTATPNNKIQVVDLINFDAPANFNTFLGFQAGLNTVGNGVTQTQGVKNTVVGNASFIANIIGTNNTVVGYGSLAANLSDQNTCIGMHSMVSNTTGQQNCAVGVNSLKDNISGIENVAVGTNALLQNLASSNVGIGSAALYANTTGTGQVAVGLGAGRAITTGGDHTAIGFGALRFCVTADGNTAVGNNALYNVLGGKNVGVGYRAGYNNAGSENIFIGWASGFYETGSSKLFIDNTTRTNEATGRISALIYGEMSATVANQIFRINGQIQGTQMHNNANAPTGTTYNYIASGTYTFTATDSANTSAVVSYESQYMRVGNVVTVSGVIDVNPILTATSTMVKIPLPIASNFTATSDCRGDAASENIASQSAAILCTTSYSSDFALMKWNSTDVTDQPMSYTFTYEVK